MTCIEILFIGINYKVFVCIFVRIVIDRKVYYHTQYDEGFPSIAAYILCT